MRTSRILLSLATTLLFLLAMVPASYAQPATDGYRFLTGIWGVGEGGDLPMGPTSTALPTTLPVTGAQPPARAYRFLDGLWGVAEGGNMPSVEIPTPEALPVTGAVPPTSLPQTGGNSLYGAPAGVDPYIFYGGIIPVPMDKPVVIYAASQYLPKGLFSVSNPLAAPEILPVTGIALPKELPAGYGGDQYILYGGIIHAPMTPPQVEFSVERFLPDSLFTDGLSPVAPATK